jgi:hypothetical protein
LVTALRKQRTCSGPSTKNFCDDPVQGEVLYSDALEREPGDPRTGVFISGIVSTAQRWKIRRTTACG